MKNAASTSRFKRALEDLHSFACSGTHCIDGNDCSAVAQPTHEQQRLALERWVLGRRNHAANDVSNVHRFW